MPNIFVENIVDGYIFTFTSLQSISSGPSVPSQQPARVGPPDHGGSPGASQITWCPYRRQRICYACIFILQRAPAEMGS